MKYVFKFQLTAFPVFELFLSRLVTADIKVPGYFGYATAVVGVPPTLFYPVCYSNSFNILLAGRQQQQAGTLVNYLGMRRVNTRGIQQANKCMLMAAVAYNLKKLMRSEGKKQTQW